MSNVVLRPVINRRGSTHFVEYLVLALVVMVATVYFFETELETAAGSTRARVAAAFESLCVTIAGVACAP